MGHVDEFGFSGTDDALVRTVLDEYGELTRTALQQYLPKGEPQTYLYDLLRDYPERGGKMMRSCLCIAAARAFGANVDDALPSAVSIELMHNALLVHDDIEDDSDERRGRPTLHRTHGIPLALNAGDALGLLAMRPLKENFHRLGISLAMRIFEDTERMAWESAEGQALELGWQRDNSIDLDDEDYLLMVMKKTCWLATIYPLRLGCLIGTHGRKTLDPLINIGFFFGAAFQIQDDLLNLEGDATYGKEINGDLFEGKRTLMIIHALRHAGDADRRRLQEFLGIGRGARSARSVAWVRALIEDCGSMDHARTVARSLAGAALFEFDAFFESQRDSRDLRFMRNLLTWVLHRSH